MSNIEIDLANLNRESLEVLPVAKLRTVARIVFRKKGVPTTWIISANVNKAQLIEAILSGEVPASVNSPAPETSAAAGDLATAIQSAISAALASTTPALDEDCVRLLIEEELAKRPASVGSLEIKVNDLPTVTLQGRQHERFPRLLRYLAAEQNVLLVGPAGSGKTSACRQAAQALQLPFEFLSFGPQTTQSQLVGFIDAGGTYRETSFRRAFEHGGVFLADEFDAANPGVALTINSAVANRIASFPDRIVEAHPNFRFVAAANTYGLGANRVYVGRNQLDGATLDRFASVEWGYDPDLELSLVGSDSRAIAWCKQIQAWRNAADRLGIRIVISPRASVAGARAIAAGFEPDEELERELVWKGLDADSVAKIKAGACA